MDDILPEDVEMIVKNIKRAVALYESDPATYNAMQVAAMKAAKDYSWVKATKQYVDHFLVTARPARKFVFDLHLSQPLLFLRPVCSH